MNRFEKIYSSNIDLVYRLAASMLKETHEAEDVAQTVFIKLYKALEKQSFSDEEHIRRWLIRVTRNETLNLIRSHKIEKNSLDGIMLKDYDGQIISRDFVPEYERTKEIRKSLEALPPKYRLTLYLFYYEGYSSSEISEILGKNHATVRTWLYNGRRKLKIEMQKEDKR